MVMQSGEDPAGGKDSKSAKPLPWKYIAIAAIVAAAILGIFFAATSGIFSGPASIADTTTTETSTSIGSGFSPPVETNSGLVATDKKDDEKSKATRIPSPNEIVQDRFIDISNPPKFVKANAYDLAITDIEISKSSNTIKASYININPEKSIAMQPVLINFFNENKDNVFREQHYCKYYGNNDQAETRFGNGYAHCQWPEDFCYIYTGQKNGKGWKIWEKYWEEKTGKKQQPQKVGSTKYNEQIIPTIEPGYKYTFTINCEIPDSDTNDFKDTKYIVIS